MERITGRLPDGTPYIKREDKRSGEKHITIKTRLPEITKTLARYEETGLTPEGINELVGSFAEKSNQLNAYRELGLTPDQIRQMDKLYREKCEEVNKLSKTIANLKGERRRVEDDRRGDTKNSR